MFLAINFKHVNMLITGYIPFSSLVIVLLHSVVPVLFSVGQCYIATRFSCFPNHKRLTATMHLFDHLSLLSEAILEFSITPEVLYERP